MNNVVTILIDSVLWECVGAKRCKVSPTPFLDSLKKESITASKLYSHGPYTDAATKSLYTGRDCMDDFGYYYRLNSSPSNHFRVFHENGYETYGIYYPYYTIGTEIKKSIDHVFYSAGFIFKSEWGGIFSYYSSISKERKLNENEWLILKKRTELMFDSWISYYKDVIYNPQCIDLIKESVRNVDVNKKLEILELERKKYYNNSELYLTELLEKGRTHLLGTLDEIDVDKSINRDLLTKLVYQKHKEKFALFSKYNFKANFLKNSPSIKRICWGLSRYIKTKNIDEIKFLANYYVCLRDIKKNREKSYGHWQDIPSARKHMKFAADVVKSHKSRAPFYLSLHILDPHNYVSFFSYDMIEDSIIDEEMEVLYDYVKNLGTDFVGSLAYFLAIRYVDFCIEEFCNELKLQNLWDKTTLLFISDHGSSYSFYPLHGARVNCFDDECYHVPVMIRSPHFNGFEMSKYSNSKDVFPTLFDIVGIEKPESFIGHSMVREDYPDNNYVMTEYMGPGCPDVLSRPIWFSIRDNHYILAYKVGIYQDFEDGKIAELYDLEKDPMAFYNIAYKTNTDSVEYLLCHLRLRFNQIRHSTDVFINNLKRRKIDEK